MFAALFGDELALRHDFALIDSGKIPTCCACSRATSAPRTKARGRCSRRSSVARGLGAAQGVTHDAFAAIARSRSGSRNGSASAVASSTRSASSTSAGTAAASRTGSRAKRSRRRCASCRSCRTRSRCTTRTARTRRSRRSGSGAVRRTIRRSPTASARVASALLPLFGTEPSWDDVLALEPGRASCCPDAEFHRACVAMADFADLKSPFSLGHSRYVGELAARAAERCGLTGDDVTAIERAGLLHDIGSVAVSSGIWCKAGALSEGETERVRMHVYYTERVLARRPRSRGSARSRRSTTNARTVRATIARCARTRCRRAASCSRPPTRIRR